MKKNLVHLFEYGIKLITIFKIKLVYWGRLKVKGKAYITLASPYNFGESSS